MGLFNRTREEYELRYRISFLGTLEEITETKNALCIDLEFYGPAQERQVSLWGSFQYYDENRYEQMLGLLEAHADSSLVKVSFNPNRPKRFRVNLDDMAKRLGSDEVKRLELLAYKTSVS